MTVLFEAKHRARTTFLRAELGFLGVLVKTRKQMAFLWGERRRAGFLILPDFLGAAFCLIN